MSAGVWAATAQQVRTAVAVWEEKVRDRVATAAPSRAYLPHNPTPRPPLPPLRLPPSRGRRLHPR